MSIHVLPDEPEQVTFDGMPVEDAAFALKSASRLWTDRKLAYNANVTGTFSGRVKGYTYVEGRLTTLVEVLDATVAEG